MHFRRWLLLLIVYIVFMIAGATVFLYLEEGHELEGIEELNALKLYIQGVVGILDNNTKGDVIEMLDKIGEQCGHDFFLLSEEKLPIWTFWNSFFFTFTVITTIGFGHMAPKTPWGRVSCILYAFIGVPLNGILIASLSDIFSTRVLRWDIRQWAARYRSGLRVAVDAVVVLVPGLVVFLVVPSVVVMVVEDRWSYLDSFYFSFITLTTIGFGDLVAGQQERNHVFVWVYKVVMVVWIIFGLGYIIMIITFVQKALKSKKILNLERKLASVLKKHVIKVHSDINTVRKVINQGPSESQDRPQQPPSSPPAHPSRPLTHTHTHTKELVFKHRFSRDTHRHRSASESDITLPHVVFREEVEGMNAVLDLIEQTLQHHETNAIKTLSHLLTLYNNNDLDEDEDDVHAKTHAHAHARKTHTQSYHNEAFDNYEYDDFCDQGEGGKGERNGSLCLGLDTPHRSSDKRSNVSLDLEFDPCADKKGQIFNSEMTKNYGEELLYFLLARRKLNTTTTTATSTTAATAKCNKNPPK